MATHSSILTWRIPWTEEPGGLQSIGSRKVGHNWATKQRQKKSRQFLQGLPRLQFQIHPRLTLHAENGSRGHFLAVSSFIHQGDTELLWAEARGPELFKASRWSRCVARGANAQLSPLQPQVVLWIRRPGTLWTLFTIILQTGGAGLGQYVLTPSPFTYWF